jgi:hypothetical protein
MIQNYREFYLQRIIDDSGVSGTGIVARGVVLLSGQCVLEWTTKHSSIGIYPNLTELLKIHGHGEHTKLMLGNPSFGSAHEFKIGDHE